MLLGYLPLERDQWAETLRRRRAAYEQFRKELIIDPHNAPAQDDHVRAVTPPPGTLEPGLAMCAGLFGVCWFAADVMGSVLGHVCSL